MTPARPMRTLAVFHLADVSGPSLSMHPQLERLAEAGPLEVVVPGPGDAADSYAGMAQVTELAYEPLVVPRAPRDALRFVRRQERELAGFRQIIRRSRPDLVVIATATLPPALLAARLERRPTIVQVLEIFDKRHVGGPVRSIGGRANLRLHHSIADGLACCSQAVARQLRGRGRAIVEVVYPGISPRHANGDGAAFRRARQLDGASPLIAVVGNIASGRGQDLAIRALPEIRRRYPGARLAIAGLPHPRPADLEFRAELNRLTAELGVADAVSFAGFVDPIADLYAAADVVVNPARFNEPFGQVAPEALVAGRPVVATRVGAIPEVLRDGRDALLVPPDDPGSIATAVVRLCDDPGLARALVRRGRERVLREFSVAGSVEAFERVVERVLEHGPVRPSA